MTHVDLNPSPRHEVRDSSPLHYQSSTWQVEGIFEDLKCYPYDY